MKIHPKLVGYLAAYFFSGLMAVIGGIYVMIAIDNLMAYFVGGVIIMAGLWLLITAIPFYQKISHIAEKEEPTEMLMRIRGSEKNVKDLLFAELRFPQHNLQRGWDIFVHLIYEDGLDQIPNNTPVNVFGAHAKNGPVVIQLGEQLLWPTSPLAVRRRDPEPSQ